MVPNKIFPLHCLNKIPKSLFYFSFLLLSILFIILGFLSKFVLTLSLPYNSDSIAAGILAREFWIHQNYLFNNITFYAADPYLFPDSFPFHMVFQYFCSFNVLGLRIASFMIFSSLVIVCAIIVFKKTNNILLSLLCVALLVCSNPLVSTSFITPTFHIGALLSISVLIYLIDIKRLYSGYHLFSALCILVFTLFSDSMFLIWFCIPILFIFYYTKDKLNRNETLFWYLSLFFIPAVYIGKNLLPNFVPLLARKPVSLDLIIPQISKVNDALIKIFTDSITYNCLSQVPSIILFSSILLILGIVVIILRKNQKRSGNLNLLFFFTVSGIITILLISFMQEYVAERYFLNLYIFCSMGLPLCIYYFKNKKIFTIITLLLIIINIPSMIQPVVINGFSPPNDEENRIISFLKEEKISSAYADYWNANIITYLSKEEILVKPVKYKDGIIQPSSWPCAKRWFEDPPIRNQTYFLFRDSNISKNSMMDQFFNEVIPEKEYHYSSYTIYEYDSNLSGIILFHEKMINSVNPLYDTLYNLSFDL